ncbi:MAG: 2-polyprenylphenol 6-hydroxylase [Candidatus Pelagibacterales bacterium]|jgi:ubiquinone biosynthesis protein|tara:strand:+ start:422 stop:1963 length:1542 start_codon:yes stop_codon:yes gene_type:complete
MIANLLFLLKIVRVFKRHNVLILIEKNIRYKIIFRLFTFLLAPTTSIKSKEGIPDGIRISSALNDLGPSFIKLGQLISTRPDIIGNKIAEDMAMLRDNLPSFPKAEAISIIEEQFQDKIENIFQNFSDPIAAASIAQVHFAEIKDGNKTIPVAVKVLRPNIIETISDEMSRLDWLTNFLENFRELKRLQLNSVIKKTREIIRFELDLRYEAAAASELKENTKNDQSFYVPIIYWEHVAKKVLTTERIDGIPADKIDDLKHNNIDLINVSHLLIINFLRQAIRDGYFHADLHQGNLFISKTGNLNAVDFGIMGRLDKKNRRFLAEIIFGFINQDYYKIAKIHKEAGLIDSTQSIDDFSQALRSIGEPIINQKAKDISMGRVLMQLFDITKQFNMSLQPQLLLLQKTMIIIEGVARRFNPEINFWEVSKPEIEKWLKDELGPLAKLKETGEVLQALARRVPDIPDFLDRAENAFDIIIENKVALKNNNKKIKSSKILLTLASGVIALIVTSILLI